MNLSFLFRELIIIFVISDFKLSADCWTWKFNRAACWLKRGNEPGTALHHCGNSVKNSNWEHLNMNLLSCRAVFSLPIITIIYHAAIAATCQTSSNTRGEDLAPTQNRCLWSIEVSELLLLRSVRKRCLKKTEQGTNSASAARFHF